MISLIDPSDYDRIHTSGMTSLYDATFDGIESILAEGKRLSDQDFSVNSILYVITDSADNTSLMKPTDIKKKIEQVIQNEEIESMLTILVGVNDAGCKKYLEDYKNQANLSQFVSCGDATPQKLAKLAAFVSQSISSQSQALGTGSASVQLNF